MGVVPALRDDLQIQRLGRRLQLLEQELAVLVEQHADAPGLGQNPADQLQLTTQRRIGPQQAQVGWLHVAEALPGLQAADAQDQSRRALAFLHAPIEARQIEQNQAQTRRQLARRRQARQWLEMHAVGGAQFAQGLDERLHAGAFLGAGQQNIGRLHRHAMQPRCQEQTKPGQPLAERWHLP
ncbi:hypothetical protein I5961_20740 [Pseudomonas sp. IAC-BECa141]|nr:hypothetical protein I5961_20740 [Pseudomonas sp. IAC-BECa141]